MFDHTFASARTRRFAVLAALALVLATAVPAVAPAADLRSPDARDQAVRSASVDLRSPDVVDRTVPPAQAPPSASSADDSVDWGYVALGGLFVVALGGGIALVLRRPRATTAAH